MVGRLFEDLLKSGATSIFEQARKVNNGKPGPYKTVGMLFGARGSLSNENMAELGIVLGQRRRSVKMNTYDEEELCDVP